jgi:4-amino-4-deoxy-L-arabinose transferase-like glycosyltransferase
MHTKKDQAGPTVDPTHAPSPAALSRRLQFWRSPTDQPGWARPALLAVAAVAALSYAWGDTSVNIETFYGAAVRSMSESWHNFFFASFDPWGTVSVDKLPGSFWVQALSLRIFGFHLWAIALPQVIEGTLTVLVLYRVVRRVAGPVAGLVSALALALSPVTVLMNRGNVSDTLLVLLLVLAADAVTRAISSGRCQTLVLAGIWVGLAFQAKMLEAWLVLPALAIAYVLAAPALSLYRRLGHVLLMGLAVIVVSVSWMTVVALVPANARPYVDGSCDNSIFSQVFLYNAGDRITGHTLEQPGCHPTSPPLVAAASHQSASGIGKSAIPGGAARFLSGGLGRDDAWFFLPSLVSFAAVLVLRRREPRRDQRRAAAVLWLAWLFFMWSFFSSSHSLNSYYLAALVPPMAALCGLGLSEVSRCWENRRVRRVLMALIVVVTLYAVALVPHDAGVRPVIVATTALAGVAALVLLNRSLFRPGPGRGRAAGLTLSALTLLLGPAWASATAVASGLGPFDTPYQPAALTNAVRAEANRALTGAPHLNRVARTFGTSVAVDTRESSPAVSTDILLTGHEFLPLGGFTGRVPSPTLRQFVNLVAAGQVRRVTVGVRPLTTNADLLWVRAHCRPSGAPYSSDTVGYLRYVCAPTDAAGR